jgi:hypothetical protein
MGSCAFSALTGSGGVAAVFFDLLGCARGLIFSHALLKRPTRLYRCRPNCPYRSRPILTRRRSMPPPPKVPMSSNSSANDEKRGGKGIVSEKSNGASKSSTNPAAGMNAPGLDGEVDDVCPNEEDEPPLLPGRLQSLAQHFCATQRFLSSPATVGGRHGTGKAQETAGATLPASTNPAAGMNAPGLDGEVDDVCPNEEDEPPLLPGNRIPCDKPECDFTAVSCALPVPWRGIRGRWQRSTGNSSPAAAAQGSHEFELLRQ